MKTERTYDYIFCGGGASACLLLLRMHEKGLLDNRSVLIIDREPKNRNDKTFCFWSTPHERITQSLDKIISHTWSEVILPNAKQLSLNSMRYHHVSSLDLYQWIDELALHYRWNRIVGDVRTSNQQVMLS
ncbi:MAG: lycopene cyclase family protein [Flavobacteriales bacterium]